MPQFARPSSDLSNTGWTRSTGPSDYALIDESVADDADYIQHSWSGAANECEVALSAISTPSSTSGHVVRYRVSMDLAGPYVDPQNLQVSLMEGASVIATQTTDVGTVALVWTTLSLNLSAGEAGSITDFGNLSLKFEQTGGDAGKAVRVSWAEYETPNAAAGSGGFNFTPSLETIGARFFDRPYAIGNGASREIQWLVYDNYVYEDLGNADTLRDGYLWEVKPQGFHDKGYKLCAWCARKVHPGRAVNYEGKWYCPEHQPRINEKGPNLWEF